MQKLIFILMCLTIAALNAILFILASSHGEVIGQSAAFDWLVNGMYLVLLSSSLLIGFQHWRKRQTCWALLFWANIGIVLVPTGLSLSGFMLMPSAGLIILDLYWLNLYWFYGRIPVQGDQL